MKAYVPLTKEQGALYENVVQSLMNKIETLSGMEKKSLILVLFSEILKRQLKVTKAYFYSKI
jgi:hypothetical protein